MKRRAFIISGIVLAGIIAILTARPAYRGIKGMRANHLSNSALEEYLTNPNDAQVLEKAILKAQTAYQLASNRYETNRVLGTILSFIRPADALGFWNNAAEIIHNQMPVDHVLAYVQCLIINGDLSKAEELLLTQSNNDPEDYRIHYNLSKLALLQGKNQQAYEFAKKLRLNASTPLELHVYFVKTGLSSSYEPWIRTANQHAKLLMENDELLSDQLIWQFQETKGLEESTQILIADKIKLRVKSFQEEIDWINFRIRNDMISSKEGFDYLNSKLENNNEGQIYLLSGWCKSHELHDKVALLMTDQMAIKQKNWYLLLLHSLYKLKNWDRIKILLDIEHPPLERFWVEIMKSQLNFETGSHSTAVNNWYRAKLNLPTELNAINTLISTGYQLDLHHETLDLIDQLVVLNRSPEKPFRRLGAILLDSGHYQDLYEFLNRFHTRYPANEEITNEWAYYALLLDKDADSAKEEIHKLCEKYPERLRYHMTWATGKIIEGKHRQVLQRLRYFEVKWEELYPKWRFLLAMALAGVGEFEQAQYYLKEIDLSKLIPEERKLYEKLMYGK